ncbi:MAG TPA: benzene 1,2-dioxygenase [Leptospiraceae bacterium]|jgi:3-phenylpropionate/trans-cinnamate dioxygenase ferredoxin subunit|nr:benzene 1,2-dioxygenase [Spirochaetaceae bacterium]HBS05809.1 benzene 1,2-dioxygenase [Leptospiraceae bacterium]|tara:strand:- start:47161 stop:47469 length:309 start_codon:yes stop_codon:yes gene_type:complete
MADKLASESEIKEGEIFTCNTRIGRVALTRLNGKICAFENTCTHDGGSLNGGKLDGKEIICPRHGARFDIESGEATRMPATESIEIYPVELKDGDVLVDLDA